MRGVAVVGLKREGEKYTSSLCVTTWIIQWLKYHRSLVNFR